MSDGSVGRTMDVMKSISSVRDAPPSAPKPIPKAEAESRPEEAEEKTPVPEPIRAPEPIQSKVQARLNYDPFQADVFLEFLDTETGEVLRRFPAEQAAEDETAKHGGVILNWLA